MSKTNNLDVAKRLASITSRPLEDFYDAPICESKDIEQTEEECVETEESEDNLESETNVQETGSDTKHVEHSVHCHKTAEYQLKYGGEIVNGKLLRAPTMSRKDFLSEKKKFKTIQDFWDSPLIYVMFRSEGQTEASFLRFSDEIEKGIK